MPQLSTSERPKVSVCCAWYNRADHIRDAIDSLLTQDFDSFEIVVVNDGSPDPRVKEIFDSYGDVRLRIIHQENAGFTLAIRRAIEASSAPYVAIMGAGDICHKARLRKQYEWISAKPGCAIVGSHFEKYDVGSGSLRLFKPEGVRRGRITGFPFSQGELMYRRSVYDEVGGYRSLFVVGQGSDLWMRMLRDHEAHVIPECLYRQLIFDDGVSKSREKIQLRNYLSRFRVDNELHYRSKGVDLIDKYGFYAPVIFNNNIVSRLIDMIARRTRLLRHQGFQ